MAWPRFHFRAVASDGKLRTGSFTAETEKLVARELRKQGLTPVYVGVGAEEGARAQAARRSAAASAATFSSSRRNFRRC